MSRVGIFSTRTSTPVDTSGSEDRVVGSCRPENRSTSLTFHKHIRLARKEGLTFLTVTGRPGDQRRSFCLRRKSGGEQ